MEVLGDEEPELLLGELLSAASIEPVALLKFHHEPQI